MAFWKPNWDHCATEAKHSGKPDVKQNAFTSGKMIFTLRIDDLLRSLAPQQQQRNLFPRGSFSESEFGTEHGDLHVLNNFSFGPSPARLQTSDTIGNGGGGGEPFSKVVTLFDSHRSVGL